MYFVLIIVVVIAVNESVILNMDVALDCLIDLLAALLWTAFVEMFTVNLM